MQTQSGRQPRRCLAVSITAAVSLGKHPFVNHECNSGHPHISFTSQRWMTDMPYHEWLFIRTADSHRNMPMTRCLVCGVERRWDPARLTEECPGSVDDGPPLRVGSKAHREAQHTLNQATAAMLDKCRAVSSAKLMDVSPEVEAAIADDPGRHA